MIKENIKKNVSHSWKNLYFAKIWGRKSVFCQNLRKKICILPNSKREKSVYTYKTSMSGRSVIILEGAIYYNQLSWALVLYDK